MRRIRGPGLPDSVGGRITAILALLLAVLVVIVAAAAWQSRQQAGHVNDSRQAFEVDSATEQSALSWLYSDVLAGRYILNPSPELAATIHSTEQSTLDHIDRARQLELADGKMDVVTDFDEIRAAAERAIVTRQAAMDATDRGDLTSAGQILIQGVTDSQYLSDAFLRITASETAEVQAASDASRTTAGITMAILMGAAIAVAFGGVFASLALSRSVVRPLLHLGETARAVGRGRFTARADVRGPREVRELATILNTTSASIYERDAALSESSERWRALVENSHDVIMVINPDMTVAFVNRVVEPMFGYKVENFVGSDALAIVHPEDVQKAAAMFTTVTAGLSTPSVNEARIRRADGTYAHMEAIPSLIRWGDHEAILLNARDMSEQRQAQETIAYMAFHDSLTGLPNRLLLQDRLETALAQARRLGVGVCVVSVDLDRFKNVNDLLGHNAGDELLKQAAGRLVGLVREGDTVARIGGDEFVLVLPECDSLDSARDMTRRLVDGFRRPFRVGDRDLHVTLSAGIARYPDHASDAETLVSNADIALYMAKDAGRDAYRAFSEDIAKRTSEWLTLEGDLRRALVEGGIEVYYQPQSRVDTGEIVGAEALARWRHPRRGILPPSEFIPLAEETGLINLLGELVLRKACIEAKAWPDRLNVAANVSLRQFERPDFLERVLAIVKDTGLPHKRLELEITESTALRDVERTKDIATRLIASGIRLSIDDFGIGNTSLRHLQELPVHRLKIDQSFMLTLDENPASAAIASSVIQLGHKLHLKVIAEGVETEEQLSFLREHRCDEFQGYLCSKPVPAGEFRALVEANVDRIVA
jgi:diguanylate cyclase (GGDEF)-like protein/PAS domain S-box-containing protein